MALVIRQLHAASSPSALNEEWFVLENVGDKPFSTMGCSVLTGKGPGKGARIKPVGTIEPGFTIAPNERVRVITGNPGKKAHGKIPGESAGQRDYHLFLISPILSGAGSIVAMSLKQHELTRATFDPKAKDGVAATTNGA